MSIYQEYQDHLATVIFFALITIIIVFAIVISCTANARGEEIGWDSFIPIVIQIESSGNPYAISEDGCIGLMQISRIVLEEWNNDPEVKKWECAFSKCFNNQRADYELFNPSVNEMIGTWYLKRIWNHYLPHYKLDQTVENLLISYNWGIGNLVKYRQGKIKNLPKETRDYIKKYHKLTEVK